MVFQGYAVVDFETTGFSPAHHHRILEIAVVHVDPWGNVEGRWETVLNPARDLGPTHVHGLRGADVIHAPIFEQVASQFVGLMMNRALVAHNAAFEVRFLAAELARLGTVSPLEAADALCTMRLASDFLPGSGRALADCCAAYDIELSRAHEALADAEATALLLSAYLRQDAGHAAWQQHRALTEARKWPHIPSVSGTWVSRRRDVPVERSFLHDTMALLPDRQSTGDATVRSYLAQLDQALADGFLSVSEADSLRDLASESGIGERKRKSLHARYFDDLTDVAWADGVLTVVERAQLERVGQLLDIGPATVSGAIAGPRSLSSSGTEAQPAVNPQSGNDAFGSQRSEPSQTENKGAAREGSLRRGDLVVLTGEMPMAREHYEALLLQHDLVPWAGVTKKVALLVAGDPDSLSGKARKARTYGTPIVSVDTFLAMLGQMGATG